MVLQREKKKKILVGVRDLQVIQSPLDLLSDGWESELKVICEIIKATVGGSLLFNGFIYYVKKILI